MDHALLQIMERRGRTSGDAVSVPNSHHRRDCAIPTDVRHVAAVDAGYNQANCL
jgi:hypothetical protein